MYVEDVTGVRNTVHTQLGADHLDALLVAALPFIPSSHPSSCRSTEVPFCWGRNVLRTLRGILSMGALRA